MVHRPCCGSVAVAFTRGGGRASRRAVDGFAHRDGGPFRKTKKPFDIIRSQRVFCDASKRPYRWRIVVVREGNDTDNKYTFPIHFHLFSGYFKTDVSKVWSLISDHSVGSPPSYTVSTIIFFTFEMVLGEQSTTFCISEYLNPLHSSLCISTFFGLFRNFFTFSFVPRGLPRTPPL